MIVLVIVTGAISLVIPRIGNKNNQMKAAIRRFKVMTKQVRSMAKLNGTSYRIGFDLGQREDDPQNYWIEKANYGVLIPGDKQQFLEDQNTAARAQANNNQKGASPSSSGFTPDDSILSGKQELPYGLRFSEIELEGLEQPIEDGRAYIHFFPQGLVEEAAIHIRYGTDKYDDGLQWTIAIHPLTGQADIITENVSLDEIKEQ